MRTMVAIDWGRRRADAGFRTRTGIIAGARKLRHEGEKA